MTSGKWFSAASLSGQSDTSEVSLESSIAEELRVKLGDVITWNVQGLEVPTRVTSLREVTWARFEPNFFAVFPSAALRAAPKQHVVLASVPGSMTVAALQRDIVTRYPNVSSIDLTLVKETVARIVDKVSTAIRFMALFSLAMGIPVLFSAVAATRRDRIREGVLLKTLGASRGQIVRILLAEYSLAGTAGQPDGNGARNRRRVGAHSLRIRRRVQSGVSAGGADRGGDARADRHHRSAGGAGRIQGNADVGPSRHLSIGGVFVPIYCNSPNTSLLLNPRPRRWRLHSRGHVKDMFSLASFVAAAMRGDPYRCLASLDR